MVLCLFVVVVCFIYLFVFGLIVCGFVCGFLFLGVFSGLVSAYWVNPTGPVRQPEPPTLGWMYRLSYLAFTSVGFLLDMYML